MGRGDVPFDIDSDVLSDIGDSESESGPPVYSQFTDVGGGCACLQLPWV